RVSERFAAWSSLVHRAPRPLGSVSGAGGGIPGDALRRHGPWSAARRLPFPPGTAGPRRAGTAGPRRAGTAGPRRAGACGTLPDSVRPPLPDAFPDASGRPLAALGERPVWPLRHTRRRGHG